MKFYHIITILPVGLDGGLQLSKRVEVVDAIPIFVLPLLALRVHALRVTHDAAQRIIDLLRRTKELFKADGWHPYEQVVHVGQTHQ